MNLIWKGLLNSTKCSNFVDSFLGRSKDKFSLFFFLNNKLFICYAAISTHVAIIIYFRTIALLVTKVFCPQKGSVARLSRDAVVPTAQIVVQMIAV